MTKIYKAEKNIIDWDAYWTVGYNYVKGTEVKYFFDIEKAKEFLGKEDKFNTIEEIEVE